MCQILNGCYPENILYLAECCPFILQNISYLSLILEIIVNLSNRKVMFSSFILENIYYLLSPILQMTDWESLIPTVSRLVCEDEVSGLAVNKKYIICQFWIQPEIAVFSRYSLELVRYGNVINWQ